MPSIAGRTSEEDDKKIEELIERGAYEDRADFVEFACKFTLDRKHGQ